MNEKNFTVSEYKKEHFNNIVNLWMEQYDSSYVEKRKKLFRWISEENPFLERLSPYFLLFDRERLIGMIGHMPLRFLLNGKQQMCCLTHDALLVKAYRGKGLGKILLKGLVEKSPFFAGALWFNEPNYKLFKKCGWLDSPNLYSFVKIFDPQVFLESRIKNKFLQKFASPVLQAGFKVKNALKTPANGKDITITEIQEFDHSFDDLFNEISPTLGISVIRNRKYLNWKFVKKPFNNYKKFAAFDSQNKLMGYMVIKSEAIKNAARGRILDFLVHPDRSDVFNALINRSTKTLLQENVAYIEIITSNHLIIKNLRKNGFAQSRSPLRFMAVNWEGKFEKEFIQNIHNWYLTGSDADGDAWSIDG